MGNNKIVRLSEMQKVNKIISGKCDEWLESIGYYSKPASLKYHGSFYGGLFYHSREVAIQLALMTHALDLQWHREESPFIVGLLHDVCKCDDYVMDMEFGGFMWNKNAEPGHGKKSVKMLADNIQLTDEERFCIQYHMGAFTDSDEWPDYNNAIKKYPNVLWTHTADMYASQILDT